MVQVSRTRVYMVVPTYVISLRSKYLLIGPLKKQKYFVSSHVFSRPKYRYVIGPNCHLVVSGGTPGVQNNYSF